MTAWTGAVGLVGAHWQAALLDLLLTILLLYPLIQFIMHGWTRRKDEIAKSLTDEAKWTYLRCFQHFSGPLGAAAAEFDRLYRDWYGRRFFVIPALLVGLIALISNFVLAQALGELIRPGSGAQLSIAAASIAGAYTFVTWDFFARMQRRNLSRVDILRGALRLAIAVPLGFAFSTLLNPSLGPFIAFAIGVFPLQAIGVTLRKLATQNLRKSANENLKLDPEPAAMADRIIKLTGVDEAIAERIEDADITTITQLAWCDPIQLTMRANLQFGYVLDIVSQALAWVYLDDKLKLLTPLGLRGAIEIRSLLQDLEDKKDPEEQKLARATVRAAAAAVAMPQEGLTYAFHQIGQDPSTEFLEAARDQPI